MKRLIVLMVPLFMMFVGCGKPKDITNSKYLVGEPSDKQIKFKKIA
jgi:hypothetical protein